MTVRKKEYPYFGKEWINKNNLMRVWEVLYPDAQNNESRRSFVENVLNRH